MMRKNNLVELIPGKWGLLVYPNEHEAVDLTTVKRFMNDDTSDVNMRLVDTLYEMDLEVPFHITSAKSGMGEEAAA